jgi:hypothetical protein
MQVKDRDGALLCRRRRPHMDEQMDERMDQQMNEQMDAKSRGVEDGVLPTREEGWREAGAGPTAGDGEANAQLPGDLTKELAAATSRIAELAGRLKTEATARQLRDALEDAGAVRVREAMRAAQMALARSGPSGEMEVEMEVEVEGDEGAMARVIAGAIEDVRAAHPEFFEQTRWASTNAADAADATDAARGATREEVVAELAARARATNDRRALLDYLRARRAR